MHQCKCMLFLLFSCSVMFNSFATPWTVAHQAPLSIGFPRQEYWSELPFPSPGDLPDPEIEPTSPAPAGGFLTTKPPGKPILSHKLQDRPHGPVHKTPIHDSGLFYQFPPYICITVTELTTIIPLFFHSFVMLCLTFVKPFHHFPFGTFLI